MLVKLRKRNKGFTLVELLLVVAILAVLAILAVPAIASTIRNSRIRTCASNEIMIEQAVWRFYGDEVAGGETLPFGTAATSMSNENYVWASGVAAAGEVSADLLLPYFRPSTSPKCPFNTATLEPYVIHLRLRNGILEDVNVVCGHSDEDTAALDEMHERASDRISVADWIANGDAATGVIE